MKLRRSKHRKIASIQCVLTAIALSLCAPLPALSETQMLDLEKDELKLGFIKLTDMAPLAIAYENGYFEDEGLYVTLEPQANWKVLLDGVITGELDGAHMLAGQPLAAYIGFGTQSHIVTPFSMDLNGNGITVSNEIWEEMKPNIPTDDAGKPIHPISASALKPIVERYKDEGVPFNMDVAYNDDDTSGDRDAKWAWFAQSGTDTAWQNPSNLGTAILSTNRPVTGPLD